METQIVYDKCMKCKCVLSPQERLDCEKAKFLPACSKHLLELKTQYLKCKPLMEKINSL